jgi:hypothetical protein
MAVKSFTCAIKHYHLVIFSQWTDLVSWHLLAFTNTLACIEPTNTLAYYRVCTLRILNVFIVQAQDVEMISH